MKIVIIYNEEKINIAKEEMYRMGKLDYEPLVDIRSAIEDEGYEVILIDGNDDIISKMKREKPDLIFNIFAGTKSYIQSYIPIVSEMLGIPFTGSDALTHSLALNKAFTNEILMSEGIPIPGFISAKDLNYDLPSSLSFPLIVKPCRGGSSKGITKDSLVNSAELLEPAISRILSLGDEALISEFIAGRELTIGIIGNDDPVIMPILETDFTSSSVDFFTDEFKDEVGYWTSHTSVAVLSAQEENAVKDSALRTYRALGCLDYGRVDIRLGSDGSAYVIDFNSLPGIYPQYSAFSRIAEEAGWNFKDFIVKILECTLQRYALA